MLKNLKCGWIVFLLLFFQQTSEAQLQLNWAENIGGGGISQATIVKTDSLGNYYIAGYFYDSIDVEPGVGATMFYHTGSDPYHSDAFLAKYDPNGNLLWAGSLGGNTESASGIDFMEVTPGGDVYIAGTIGDTVDFDFGAGVSNLDGYLLYDDPDPWSPDELTTYLAKYNANGTFAWGHIVPEYGTNHPAFASDAIGIKGIGIDDADNVYIGGNFYGDVDLDPGAGTANYSAPFATGMMGTYTRYYGFVSQFDASGNHSWSFEIGNDGIELETFTVHNNKIFIGGDFQLASSPAGTGIADFDPTGTVYQPPSAHNYSGFLARYSTNETLDWVKVIDKTSAHYGGFQSSAIQVDDWGVTLVGSVTTGGWDFDMSAAGSFVIDGSTGSPVWAGTGYFMRYDTDGNLLWGGETSNQLRFYGVGLSKDYNKGLYVSYLIPDSIDVDLDTAVVNMHYATTMPKTVFCRYDSLGQLLWVDELPNVGGTLQAVSESSLVLAGSFKDASNDFDFGSGVTALSATAITYPQIGVAAFAKYTDCRIVIASNVTDVSCKTGNDGIVDASTTDGGKTPFGYQWSTSSTASSINTLSAGDYYLTLTDANGCVVLDTFAVAEPDSVLSTTISTQAALCNGGSDGSATIVALGGTAGYSFLWSNNETAATANNLSAGTHSVTTTDINGCTVVATDTIQEPSALTDSFDITPVSCQALSDGAVTTTIAGGTGAHSFVWSNGDTTSTINNVYAGTYYMTVTDANNCTLIDSVIVTSPLALLPNLIEDNITCLGDTDGNLYTYATGGTAPYNYLWSTGSTDTALTNIGTSVSYSLTLTDANGCEYINTYSLFDPMGALNVDSIVIVDLACNGDANGQISISTYGGWNMMGYTSLWSTGTAGNGYDTLSNLSAGTYTATVTDLEGCTDVTTVVLVEPAVLSGSINGTNASCGGCTDGAANVVASGGTIPFTYLWSSGETTLNLQNLGVGTYIVTVTDANGCTYIDSVDVSNGTSVNNINEQELNNFNVYPNPSDGQFMVDCSTMSNITDMHVEVFDVMGQLVFQQLYNSNKARLDINNFVSGMYMIRVNQQYTKKIVLRE